MSSSDVCNTQDDFNTAFRKAVKYLDKKERPALWVRLIMVGIAVIFITWALILAMRVQMGDNKIIHLVLALLVSPFYILSYYLSGTE